MSSNQRIRDGRLVGLICLVLTLGTLACYWPVRHFEFLNIDDDTYVTQARLVREGLSWRGLVWSCKTFDGGNWNPLVWVSHMADCQIYHLQPGGHHLTNLILHTANVLLLFWAFHYMTGAIWRSALVAAVLAWHPMHVESVAWVSERKDVLSTFFWLATMGAYAMFAKSAGPRRRIFHAAALILFALGLMCKAMLVTLPLVLLLLDYWPLRRPEDKARLVLEKVPFLVLSAGAAAVAAIWAQHRAGALDTTAGPGLRMENALVSYATYVVKLFWPSGLAFFYPLPKSIPLPRLLGAVLLIGGMSWAVLVEMKKRPHLAVGWFWFLGTLVPVIGLVQVGMQSLADRYTYVPDIGLALAISWGLGELIETYPAARTSLVSAAALAMAGCLVATYRQASYWHDNAALYNHALKVTTGNYIAHDNLGEAFLGQGQLTNAAEQFRAVIELMPGAAMPYNGLGTVSARQGQLNEAIAMFSTAIQRDPAFSEAHFNLGYAYLRQGQPAAAAIELKTALKLKPDDDHARSSLIDALFQSGEAAEALPYCEAFVADEPLEAQAHFDLGSALLTLKRPEQALPHFQEAARLAPDLPQPLNALAWIYATSPTDALRNGAEAVKLATRANELSQRPRPEFLDTLAAAYAETGHFDDAIKTTAELRALAVATHDTNTEASATQRLKLYQAGKPYRDDQ